jgi:uncharacterized protein (TIGR02001 family)
MKLSQGVAAILLLGAGAIAHAEITGTVTGTTDYNWRGVTQSSQNPALQGSIDYAHDSGFYAGAWASTIDFGDDSDADVEVDLYLGFGGGDTFPWDVGVVWYTYPGSNGDATDFPEVYGSLGYKWIEGKISYTSNFGGLSEQAWYYEANANFDLPLNLTLGLHAGYSDGDGIKAAYDQGDYFDWSAGLSYTLWHFDLNLKYVDGSDLKTLDGTYDDLFSSESTVIFTVSTTFPWSKE